MKFCPTDVTKPESIKFFQKLIDVIVYIGVNLYAGNIVLTIFAQNCLIFVVAVWWCYGVPYDFGCKWIS